MIPLLAFDLYQDESGKKSGNKRDSQIDKDAFGNLTDGNAFDTAVGR